jgi:hypothetical protein
LGFSIGGTNVAGACEFLPPFDHVGGCSAPAFSLSGSDLPSSGNLTVKFGDEKSNTLSLERWVVEELSNTRNDLASNDDPTDLRAVGTDLYFVAKNRNGAEKLFDYDGIQIVQITDTIGDQSTDDEIIHPIIYNDSLYFGAKITPGVGGHRRLYRAVGTTLSRITGTGAWGDFDFITEFDGKLIMPVSDAQNRLRIVSYDGSTLTRLSNFSSLTDIDENCNIPPLTVGIRLYFCGNDSSVSYAHKVIRYDGSAFQLAYSTDIGTASGNLETVASQGDNFYYGAEVAEGGYKLFRYLEGDPEPVVQVSNTTGDAAKSDLESSFHCSGDFGGAIYCRLAIRELFDASPAWKLFKLQGKTLTRVIDTSDSATTDDDPWILAQDSSYLYFSAKNSQGVAKLYRMDLGGAVTQIADSREDEALSDDILYGVIFQDAFFYAAKNTDGAYKLFRYKRGQLQQISNTSGSSGSNDIPPPTFFPPRDLSEYGPWIVGNTLYFQGINPQGGQKLYRIYQE